MLGSPSDTYRQIKDFLFANGASDYAVLYLPSVYNDIVNGNIKVIFAPIDEALGRLAKAVGKPIDDMAKIPEGKYILNNSISYAGLNKSGYPVYMAINGVKYGNTVADLNKLDSRSAMKFGNISVAAINKVIADPDQIDKLKAAIARQPSMPIPQPIYSRSPVQQTRTLPRSYSPPASPYHMPTQTKSQLAEDLKVTLKNTIVVNGLTSDIYRNNKNALRDAYVIKSDRLTNNEFNRIVNEVEAKHAEDFRDIRFAVIEDLKYATSPGDLIKKVEQLKLMYANQKLGITQDELSSIINEVATAVGREFTNSLSPIQRRPLVYVQSEADDNILEEIKRFIVSDLGRQDPSNENYAKEVERLKGDRKSVV